MRAKAWLSVGAVTVAVGAVLAAGTGSAGPAPGPAVPFTGQLSVLTYNVEGLPWPIRSGRADALAQIGARLAVMRSAGREPAVVVLQEAFTDDGAAIAREAGYRYTSGGLGAHAARDDAIVPVARPFADGASWLKGEAMGKYVGSGLRVMSDYPIVRMTRMAFPAYACAGYDCLANKGVMMVTVAPPGGPLIDVVATHLNSRTASGTDDTRSLFAYRLQIASLAAFVRANHDPAHPLIVAGDFNVGKSPERRATLLAAAAGWSSAGRERDALGTAVADGAPLSADALWSRQRAKDWQFYDDGARGTLALQSIDVPFGRDAHGAMLSDHVGYTATYRVSPSPLTTPATATATRIAAAAGYTGARS